MMSTHTVRVVLKPTVFIASLYPLAFDAWAVFRDQLGPHPYRILIQDTGVWTLWFLIFTLALTPLRRLTSWPGLAVFRRMLGLFAFFYGTVHTLLYLVLDRFATLDVPTSLGSWSTAAALTVSTARDIWDKPFLATGLAAFLAMVPLAATSTSGVIRRLGGRRWRQLHRLVYAAAIAGLVHHWWPLADRFRVDKYGMLIAAALAFRVAWYWTRSSRLAAPYRSTRHDTPDPRAAAGRPA